MDGFHETCHSGVLVGHRTDHGKRLDKHTDTTEQVGTGRTTIVDGQVEDFFFPCQTTHGLGKDSMHKTAYRDTVSRTELLYALVGKGDEKRTCFLTIGQVGIRHTEHVGTGCQCLKILLGPLVDRGLLHGLLIECKVVRCDGFRLQWLAVIGCQHTLQEHIRRQTVIDDMVNVGKEVDMLGCLIYFNSIEPVVKQVEGSHPVTEERHVGVLL